MQRFWPAPALGVWLLAWVLSRTLHDSAAPWWAVLGLPALLGLVLAQWPQVAGTRWRAVFVAAGFPVSALLVGGHLAQGMPAWGWLVPLGLLLLAYPVRAWRDAPLFPTPPDALQGLPAHAPLHFGAAVLDAGCGLGDGLIALRRAYPDTRLHGTEWSWPLALACKLRCPWATVQRGDMWAQGWQSFDMVYLFQRPETMPGAVAKARAEMRPGTWLVSLEFEARDVDGQPVQPTARITLPGGRPVWLYRW